MKNQKPQHTPGPWLLSPENEDRYIKVNDGRNIAGVFTDSQTDDKMNGKGGNMKIKLTSEQEEAKEWFINHCPRKSTVYTILRRVSRSGMSRVIGLIVIGPNKRAKDQDIFHPNYSAAKLLRWRLASGEVDGIKVSGCGMDMGFHLVYSLAQAVYGDGYALNHRWL